MPFDPCPLGLHFRERMVPAKTLSTSYLRSSQRIACRTSSHKFPVCTTHRRNCFHSKTVQSSNLKGMTSSVPHINIKRGSQFCVPNIGQSVLQENTGPSCQMSFTSYTLSGTSAAFKGKKHIKTYIQFQVAGAVHF